jgi:hypothetical protein
MNRHKESQQIFRALHVTGERLAQRRSGGDTRERFISDSLYFILQNKYHAATPQNFSI